MPYNESTKSQNQDAAKNTHRRFTLVTRENPKTAIDYLISLQAQPDDELSCVQVTYIPDKLLLQPEAFEQYLHDFSPDECETMEELALTILDDLNNELVPRWVQVRVTGKSANQHILVEDRQPSWSNEDLMSRLSKF